MNSIFDLLSVNQHIYHNPTTFKKFIDGKGLIARQILVCSICDNLSIDKGRKTDQVIHFSICWVTKPLQVIATWWSDKGKKIPTLVDKTLFLPNYFIRSIPKLKIKL